MNKVYAKPWKDYAEYFAIIAGPPKKLTSLEYLGLLTTNINYAIKLKYDCDLCTNLLVIFPAKSLILCKGYFHYRLFQLEDSTNNFD